MFPGRGGSNHQSGVVMASVLTYLTKSELADLAFELFSTEGSSRELEIDPSALRQFITAVGENYRDNPYHNFHHAVDVVKTMSWMLSCPTFHPHLSADRRFILMLSCLVHDVGHPGHNNQYEVKTGTERSRKYDNAAVLEKYALDLTLKLLEEPECQVFKGWKPPQLAESHRMLKEMVLATDFDSHPVFMAGFLEFLEKSQVDFKNPEFLSWVSRALIKAADIANTAKPFEEAKRWGRRIMMEFWAQGVEEKERRLTVGPINDPQLIHVNQTQADFIRFAALGLFERLSALESAFSPMVVNLKENLRRYQEMDKRGMSLFD